MKSDRLQMVSTNYGQRATLRLPEGTKIVLNANSTLKYPAVWNGQTARELQLHGEAYFDVADRPEGPQDDFIVLTDDGFIRVVGTKFVVYERGNGTRVVLEKGGVEVTPVDTSALRPLPAAKVLLTPGHLLYFKKGTHFLRPISVNVLPYMTWWLDQIVLQETPFAEIVQRLEETYGVKVEVRDKELLKRTLSGSIENRNLEIITDALAKALRVSVHREGETIIFYKSSS
ncbi:MAG: FecR family protein [bacterium]